MRSVSGESGDKYGSKYHNYSIDNIKCTHTNVYISTSYMYVRRLPPPCTRQHLKRRVPHMLHHPCTPLLWYPRCNQYQICSSNRCRNNNHHLNMTTTNTLTTMFSPVNTTQQATLQNLVNPTLVPQPPEEPLSQQTQYTINTDGTANSTMTANTQNNTCCTTYNATTHQHCQYTITPVSFITTSPTKSTVSDGEVGMLMMMTLSGGSCCDETG